MTHSESQNGTPEGAVDVRAAKRPRGQRAGFGVGSWVLGACIGLVVALALHSMVTILLRVAYREPEALDYASTPARAAYAIMFSVTALLTASIFVLARRRVAKR